jgi:hypothetical protein
LLSKALGSISGKRGVSSEKPKNKFSKVIGPKINTQKLVVFLCTNNHLSEKEVKKPAPFTIALKIA